MFVRHSMDRAVGQLCWSVFLILMYTGWSYWVFRGKVRGDVGYC